MRPTRMTRLLLLLFAAWTATLHAPLACGQQIAPEAKKYLNQALDILREHAIDPKQVDWKLLRQQSFVKAQGAQTAADTYPAIIDACAQLRRKDQCNMFLLPDSSPVDVRERAQEAEQATAARPRKVRTSVGSSSFLQRKELQGFLLKDSKGKAYAYLVVPQCIPPFTDAASNQPFLDRWTVSLRELLITANDSHPDGWIVDLRGNPGKNMWAAIAALGPLLGEGRIGVFHDKEGEQVWVYADGRASIQGQRLTGQNYDNVKQTIGGRRLSLADSPVAVLFDGGTAGSGEAIAIAFAGRKKERSFGAPTKGDTGCCSTYKLSDSAVLAMQFGVEGDRLGRLYLEGLRPDTRVEADPSSTADPVIHAAEEWLSTVSP